MGGLKPGGLGVADHDDVGTGVLDLDGDRIRKGAIPVLT